MAFLKAFQLHIPNISLESYEDDVDVDEQVENTIRIIEADVAKEKEEEDRAKDPLGRTQK